MAKGIDTEETFEAEIEAHLLAHGKSVFKGFRHEQEDWRGAERALSRCSS